MQKNSQNKASLPPYFMALGRMLAGFMAKISEINIATSGQVQPSSSRGIAACRLLDNRCLALVRYITRSVTLSA